MFGLGATEIIVVLVIALLVLGPKRLPEAARSLGRGLGEFRRASSELRNALTAPADEIRSAVHPPAVSARPQERRAAEGAPTDASPAAPPAATTSDTPGPRSGE